MKPRLNPFASCYTDHLSFRCSLQKWKGLLRQLKQQDYCCAIVGPHGSGKTTLLIQLKNHFQKKGTPTLSLFINSDKPWLSFPNIKTIWDLDPETIIFFDGADLLPRWHWWIIRLMAKRKGGMIITSHTIGLLPTLIKTHAQIKILDQLIKDLSPKHAYKLRPLSHKIFKKHHGNMHNVLRDLYMIFASDQWEDKLKHTP